MCAVAIGIERRGRLVHQQHLGLHRQRARDAEALLLAAGEAQRALVQAILDLVPERRLRQRPLDARVDLARVLDAADAQAVGDVLVDRLGERVRALEHHADAPADRHRIDARGRRSDRRPA